VREKLVENVQKGVETMQNSDNPDDGWLTGHENECEQEIEQDCELAGRLLDTEKEQTIKNIWTYFLDSAEFITQLYKDRQLAEPGTSCWQPFQTAAGNVTKLYKESCDGMRRSNELAIAVGYQRRNKELAEWVRNKRRRYIRREELMSFLAGKQLPDTHTRPRLRLSPRPAATESPQFGGEHGNQSPTQGARQLDSADLHTFKEALALRPRAPDLYTFVVGEIARHCKRPASPLDVNMDSPTVTKRPRYNYE